MTERRDWNYWMCETIPDPVLLNGRTISIFEGKDLDKGDIRNEKYSLDPRKWCLEHYWDAEQAALISFGRDPDKVKNADAYDPFDEEDDDYKKHLELIDQMKKRHLQIKDAQKKKYLTPKFFFPAMYIAWSERLKLSFPDYVKKELAFVERERKGEVKPIKFFPSLYAEVEANELSENESEQVSEKKGGSQQKRYDNNVTKLVLALLIEADLLQKDPKDLSDTLADILMTKAYAKKDENFRLGADTIRKRIEEAHDLLK